MAGKFITFEGGEGTGKSTQSKILAERLEETGHKTFLTREPGGSLRAEQIRDFLLSGRAKEFGPVGEALLFFAARDDHLEKRIRPALDKDVWVICDRFADSTRAYQGTAGGVRQSLLATLERLVVAGTRPDMTVILDLPASDGLKRASAETPDGPDHFEAKELGFHEALRNGFLQIAKEHPDRCVVIDASEPVSAVAEQVWDATVERLNP